MVIDKEKRKRRMSLPNWLPATRKISSPASIAKSDAHRQRPSVSPLRFRRNSQYMKKKQSEPPLSPTAALCRIEIIKGGVPEEYVIHEDATISDVRNLLGLPLSTGAENEPFVLREGNTRAILGDHVEVSVIGSKKIILEEYKKPKRKGTEVLKRQTVELIESFYKSEKAFYRHLQDDIDLQCSELKDSGFSRKDCNSLFNGLESYINTMNELLENISNNGLKNRRGLVDSLKQFWTASQEYYFTFHTANKVVAKTIQRLAGYSIAKREFMQEKIESKPVIKALLIMPIQRVPQYDRFLTDLITVPKSDLSKEDLDFLQSSLKHISFGGNIDFSRAQNEFKVLQVQDRFPNDDLRLNDELQSPITIRMRDPFARRQSAPSTTIVKAFQGKSSKGSPNTPPTIPNFRQKSPSTTECFDRPEGTTSRLYIQEGPVRLSTGVSTSDRVLILFSDLLLVAKAKSASTFKLKHRIKLCEAWLSNCIDEVSDTNFSLDTSFVIGWPTTNFVVSFSSLEDRMMWWNILSKQVNQQRILEQPKVTNLKICCRQSDDSSVCSKSLPVCIDDTARDVIKLALDHFEIKDEEGDFQLWAISDKENTAYPLIGHELPFAIKMNHLRDTLSSMPSNGPRSPRFDQDSPPLSPDALCQFILKKSRKSSNRLHLDLPTSQKKWRKPMKKSPIINWSMNKNKNGKLSDSGIPTGSLFGHNLSSITSEQERIPKPIYDTLVQLFRRGPATTGVFRKSALQRRVKELRENFDTGIQVDLESVSVVVLAALLKDFLRSLPNSLLGSDNYGDLQRNKLIDDTSERINDMSAIVSKLPISNSELLKAFVNVLYHIARFSDINNMTPYNLAVCVAPSVMWSPPTTKASAIDQSGIAADVVQFLIDYYIELFGEESITILGTESDICLESTMNGDDSETPGDTGSPNDVTRRKSIDDNDTDMVPLSMCTTNGLARSDSSFGTNDSECSQDGLLSPTRNFASMSSPTPSVRSETKSISSPVSPILERKSSSPVFSRVESYCHSSVAERRHSSDDARDCNANYEGINSKPMGNRRALTSVTTSAELIEHKRPGLTPMMIKKTSVGGTTLTQVVKVFTPASPLETIRSNTTMAGFVPYFQRPGPAPSYEETVGARHHSVPSMETEKISIHRIPSIEKTPSSPNDSKRRVQTETYGMELIRGSPSPKTVPKKELLTTRTSESSGKGDLSSDDELSSDAGSRRSSEDIPLDRTSSQRDLQTRKFRRGRHKLPVRRTGSEPNQTFGAHRTFQLSLERMERLRKARIQEKQYDSSSQIHCFDSNTMRQLPDFTNKVFENRLSSKENLPLSFKDDLPNGLIREPFHLAHPRRRTSSKASDNDSQGRSSTSSPPNFLPETNREEFYTNGHLNHSEDDGDDDDDSSELSGISSTISIGLFNQKVRRLSSTGSESLLSDDKDTVIKHRYINNINNSNDEINSLDIMKTPSPEDLKRILLQDESYV